jgi:hypothetical protein
VRVVSRAVVRTLGLFEGAGHQHAHELAKLGFGVLSWLENSLDHRFPKGVTLGLLHSKLNQFGSLLFGLNLRIASDGCASWLTHDLLEKYEAILFKLLQL